MHSWTVSGSTRACHGRRTLKRRRRRKRRTRRRKRSPRRRKNRPPRTMAERTRLLAKPKSWHGRNVRPRSFERRRCGVEMAPHGRPQVSELLRSKFAQTQMPVRTHLHLTCKKKNVQVQTSRQHSVVAPTNSPNKEWGVLVT